ncbi:MAG: YbaN family protein [Blastocatellia bacterium]|nr:YbaN family protein [Blastocatellia bacterium]
MSSRSFGKVGKKVLVLIGSLFVGLGVLGVFLPLLPGTPFFLLAAACYAKSSPQFHNWLLNHKIVGHYVRDYHEKGGMRLKAKLQALLLLWLSIIVSYFFLAKIVLLKIVMLLVATGVTLLILSIKTIREDN